MCDIKNTILLIFLLSVGSIKVRGQEQYQPNKIIPPSPTAASLGIFGETNISYFTGAHNITIPIFSDNSGGAPVNITLDYNSPSGIKVAQDASWVGLGWTLSVGGVISRSIRGLDDLKFGGYNSIEPLPQHDENNYVEIPSYENAPQVTLYFRNIDRRQKDGEPDVFYYNFSGNAGKFYLGKHSLGDSIYVENQNNLNIKFESFSNPDLGRWIITTDEGYKYYFGKAEKTENYYKSSDVTNRSGLEPNFIRSYDESVSAWYLDSIVNANGITKVRFQYEIGLSLSLINTNQKRYDLLGMVAQPQGVPVHSLYNYYNSSRQVINDVHLRKIEYDKGSILFNREEREDIEPYCADGCSKPQRLSSIEIYNLNNVLQKKFVFSQSYFNNNYNGSFKYEYKRLKLDSVVEFGKNNAFKKPYKLDYFDPNNLFSKYSRQVDESGYASSFYSFIPSGEFGYTLLPEVTTNWYSTTRTFEGIKRKPDATMDFSRRGLIKSITYPTGGSTEFEYEPNSKAIFPRVDTVYGEVASARSFNSDGERLIDQFTLNNNQSVLFDLRTYPIADERISRTEVIGYLKNSANVLIRSFSLSDSVATLNLSPGLYFIEVLNVLDYHNRLYASTSDIKIVTNEIATGLRLKRLINYDENGLKQTVKRLVYTHNGLESGNSTGKIISEIRSYERPVYIWGSSPGTINYRSSGLFLVRSSSSINPLGSFSSSAPTSYSDVFVLEGENRENGSTHYNYHNLGASITYQEPELPVNFSSLNGKLNYQRTLDIGNNVLKRRDFTYLLKKRSIIKGAKIIRPYPDRSEGFIYEEGDVRFYDNISEWWVTASEEETDYSNGKALARKTLYSFGNDVHKQKTSEEFVKSDGATSRNTYKYPTDFSLEFPYQEMITKNIISPIIEKRSYNDLTEIDATKTNYAAWPNGVIAPITVTSSRAGNGYDTRLRFHGYNENGGLSSVSKENDVVQSYIWGYNQSYPVIKAENLPIQELETKLADVLTDLAVTSLDGFLNGLGDLTTTVQKATWKLFNQKLRAKFNTQKVLLATYTYNFNFGMSSECDANSRMTYYEYDAMGRVSLVRDDENNILKTYDYNYKQ